MFFGAFIMRYRFELILSFPFVSLVMAIYFYLAFEHDSAVQNPEKLYREPPLFCQAPKFCVSRSKTQRHHRASIPPGDALSRPKNLSAFIGVHQRPYLF